jgi:ABC-type nickel/cobalt efflux system permease component RcnA
MEGSIIATLGLALLLGIEHAMEPDHLIAVTSLVARHRTTGRAILQGALWGLGHTTTLFVAGLLVLLLKVTIPARLALSFEFAVGLVIVGLGMHLIVKLFTAREHTHAHTHDGVTHTHAHAHSHSHGHSHAHMPFLVGIVHGMAGSAALMLLILSTLQSTLLGLGFIVVFGLGSIAVMMTASYIISIPYRYTANNLVLANKRLRYITGVFAIAFGVFLLVKVGYIEGLII